MPPTRLEASLKRLLKNIYHGVSDEEMAKYLAEARQMAGEPDVHVDKDWLLDTYNGLVEKFYVLGRVDLSTELEQRLERLQSVVNGRINSNNIDLVHLLFLVSDTPQDNDIPLIPNASEHELTYQDILAESPLEDELEEMISIADTLSDWSNDEPEYVDLDPEINEPPETRFETDSNRIPATRSLAHLAIETEKTSLGPNWHEIEEYDWILSENDIIREILLTFLGNPSLLFEVKDSCIRVRPAVDAGVGLYHVSAELLYESFLPQLLPMISISYEFQRLSQVQWAHKMFDTIIANVYDTLIASAGDLYNHLLGGNIMTLVTVVEALTQLVSPYNPLLLILREVNGETTNKCHDLMRLHNLVYDYIEFLQQAGRNSESKILVGIFEQLLAQFQHEYLFPWLQGKDTDSDAFFITCTSQTSSLWHRYTINHENVPTYLHNCSQLVLDIGRSAKFLVAKDKSPDLVPTDWHIDLTGGNFSEKIDSSVRLCLEQLYRSTTKVVSSSILCETDFISVLQSKMELYFMLDQRIGSFCYRVFEAHENGVSLQNVLLDHYRLSDLSTLFTITSSPATSKGTSLPFYIEVKHAADQHNYHIFSCMFTQDIQQKYKYIWAMLFRCGQVAFSVARTPIGANRTRLKSMSIIGQIMGYFQAQLCSQMKALLAKLQRDYSLPSISQVIELHKDTVDECYSLCTVSEQSIAAILHSITLGCENIDELIQSAVETHPHLRNAFYIT